MAVFNGGVSLGDIYAQADASRAADQRNQMGVLALAEAQKQHTDQEGIDTALTTDPNASFGTLVKAGGGMAGVKAATEAGQARSSDAQFQVLQKLHGLQQQKFLTDQVAADPSKMPQVASQLQSIGVQGHPDGWEHLPPDQIVANATKASQALDAQIQSLTQQLVPPDKQYEAQQKASEDRYKQEGPGGEAARNAATIAAENARNAATTATTKRGQDLEAQSRGIPSGYRRAADGKSVEAIPGGPADVSTNWSDEAIQTAGERFRLTGQMPPLGRNGQVIAGKIASAAAASASAQGQTAEAAAYGQIASKANVGALTALTKQQNMVGAFEKTAQANMDLAETELGKLELSGSPIVNKAVNAFRQGITGDPQTARFVNALTAARTEYAKVLSGSTGGQGITDAARGEANELFSKNMSPEGLRAALQVARTEMRNRMTAFDAQKAELQGSIRGGGAPAAPTGQPAAPPASTPTAAPPPNIAALLQKYQ